MIPQRQVFSAVFNTQWLFAIFLVGPLMAILSVNVSVIVSSRTNDPRVAEQISMIVILPLMLVFFGQLAGLFILNNQLILLSAVALIFIDALLVRLAVHLFQREIILTRWK
jgi:ABC-2 type transport system permease protein